MANCKISKPQRDAYSGRPVAAISQSREWNSRLQDYFRGARPEARKITSLVLAFWLLAALFAVGEPCPVAADGPITVIESNAIHSFAQQITFTLHATSDAEITQVYLFFRAAGKEQTEAIPVEIDSTGKVNYMHDLRRSPLPPFATVTFWWHIEGVETTTVTDPQQFEYTDNRFQWEQVSAGGITIHWIRGHGNPVFGQAALDIATASVEEIDAELRASRPESINIYIYDGQPNLNAAMALTGREWVVGQAQPELGVIVTAIPFESADGHLGRMKRYIPHEITHLLIYQAATQAGYRYVPEWLDEGLATANEQLPSPDHTLVLEEARTQGWLLPLESLCVPFPPNPQTAFLAYAQSGSVVRFIREQYGAKGIRDLLAAYRDGASCAVGVQESLNVSLSGLETTWQASLEPQSPWRVIANQVGVWVSLWLLSLLVAIPMIGRRARQSSD